MKSSHVTLTSHPGHIFKDSLPIKWGAADPIERGPLIATLSDPSHRNAIGTHSGSYTVYRALASAAGLLPPTHRADLTNTTPVETIGPHPSWSNPKAIVSLDPWGALPYEVYRDYYEKGYDIQPTTAITKAHIHMPELEQAVDQGRLKVDGKVVLNSREVVVTKAAIEPVWYLPGVAERYNVTEGGLRRSLFEQTGGMFPELITRPDLKILLPPIGSNTVYMFGDVSKIHDPKSHLTVRVHDECNGSDVFGSDICTCRPYLAHGIEEAIRSAQEGGTGVIVYFRKEGRALGEVTKFLVYNARKRQPGGDSASNYFHRTECVAGVQDMRFQELMPDTLHWLGITKIDRLVSMSDMKYDAIAGSGIEVKERVAIPDELVPEEAGVEMAAKKAAGYFTDTTVPSEQQLEKTKGRHLSN